VGREIRGDVEAIWRGESEGVKEETMGVKKGEPI